MRHTNISAFLIILASLILTSCSENNENIFSGNAFGTIYYININDNYNNNPIQIKSTIEEIIYNINNSASSYNKNSEISVFNFSNDTSYKLISSNLYNIIFKANKVSNLTNGYFDITIGDIKIKKGFPNKNRVEDHANIAKLTTKKTKTFIGKSYFGTQ